MTGPMNREDARLTLLMVALIAVIMGSLLAIGAIVGVSETSDTPEPLEWEQIPVCGERACSNA